MKQKVTDSKVLPVRSDERALASRVKPLGFEFEVFSLLCNAVSLRAFEDMRQD